MNGCWRDGEMNGADKPREKDEAHGASELAGKLSDDIVGTADVLTKDGTKTGLPVPGEAGNCALGLVEATDKLGPGKKKLDVAAGGAASGKDKATNWSLRRPELRSGQIALTIEAVKLSKDKPEAEDELTTKLTKPAEEELDTGRSGLTGERSEFEFAGSVAMSK